MTDAADAEYAAHLRHVTQVAAAALEESRHDEVLIYGGTPQLDFRDDHGPRFVANPQLLWWVPLGHVPYCWLRFRPGDRPQLTFHQPSDYWHLPPEAPAGEWTRHVDIEVRAEPVTARELLNGGKVAVLGDLAEDEIPDTAELNPESLTLYLDYHRATKTPYEIACMAEATRLGVRGHRAAEHAFREGASEYEIHMRYCAAMATRESELPYGNIVALNEHAAVLHYQNLDTEPPRDRRSFLIDAGAAYRGYASDITRTYASADDEFGDLIEAMNDAQQRLADKARSGVDYADLHLDAHREVASLLKRFDLVSLDPEKCVEEGVSGSFFPHGLGHFLGLQVHDMGGLQKDPDGNRSERPEGHPYLRLTRSLEPGHALTIEPGIYFIDLLLDRLEASKHARYVDWKRVAQFKPYGGIRIEDNVVVQDAAPRNLTREAFSAS